ncbi:MAG: aromatic ring-hydroxylating dioxygenase subunit alpha [Hydrogenophaga sp.]|uniref:aromatic ring-hydroxylating oxygenase subunit alpha n=1 Tax=Hydrogenophaga sp. TaxID=1904254 RepID=UPI002736FA51|nr:aromatic ring-hydroxylating dioxygenase subunit alpha [Hydrogenophaga sp.]MDP3627200.1 aromatic ring-hydroxylating dioxygenase subunit alpha [Hydrogenophaga sp.]MDZ4279406.1 aromatic ring-hydroxylating dioxygenase subunit alpha [Hydrogenophaga sp.]
MRHEQQVEMIERALALIAEGTSERGDPAVSPVSRYTDTDRYEQELRKVFKQYPVTICPSASLAAPGDTLAVEVAGTPLLLVRSEDGSVSGFLNACRHRGARIAQPGKSSQRVFVCPYHSWSYDLNGSLRGRPHGADFPHAPARDCSLVRIPAGEALGFVWAVPRAVRPGESASLDLSTYLGRFGEDLRNWGYDSWVPFDEREFSNKANWKIPFEGNLETYHFQYAHRNSIAHLFYDNLLLADYDGDHQRIFLPKRTISSMSEEPRNEWVIGPHSNIIYYFFPATFILHEGDHCNMFTVLPETVSTSRVRAITMIPEAPQTPKSANYWRKNVDSFWGALSEDFALGESCQSTFASGANEVLQFGSTECAAARFHQSVEQALERI